MQDLICELLDKMGLETRQTGHVNQPDGGIDIIAWSKHPPFPFLLAIQVKHHRKSNKRTWVPDVRSFHGAIASQGSLFTAGLIVTNTTFTPNAEWFAKCNSAFLRLRDARHLKRWLLEDYYNPADLAEIPPTIEVTRGLTIDLKPLPTLT